MFFAVIGMFIVTVLCLFPFYHLFAYTYMWYLGAMEGSIEFWIYVVVMLIVCGLVGWFWWEFIGSAIHIELGVKS